MIVTRFAPSPTGDPHIGNIRSALFEYLFARANKGEFLLRIEDTDQKRLNPESLSVIKEALKWLGITPENLDNPMIQSTRLPIYQKIARQLVEEGKAYVCDCSKERLEKVRDDLEKKGLPPKYDRFCRNRKLEFKDGETVIRMIMPDKKIVVDDLIRGRVEFDPVTYDDQVILKSDGFPTYHLAHVVDDNTMKITHIIRGEEWLPSTAKHIALNEMLGYAIPQYAHLPVILAADHGKLSKRHGATAILEYKKMGYLPEAIINFMVLLGWNPKTDEEFFTLSELEKRFDFKSVNKAPAIFNREKLDFFNRHYLRLRPASELIPLLDQNIVQKIRTDVLNRVVEQAKQRMTTLNDFEAAVKYLISMPEIDPNLLVFKKSTPEITAKALRSMIEIFLHATDWTAASIKQDLEKVVADGGFSNGDVFWPTRYALSGEEKSPPPEELADILGQQETVERLKEAAKQLG